MFYDRLTRRLHVEIGEEEYLLAFTLGGLQELESRAGKPIIDIASAGTVPPLSILVDGFWIALRDGGNDKRYTRNEGEKLASRYIEESEDGVVSLGNLFFLLIGVSGLMGAKFRHQMLEQAGLEDKDESASVAETPKKPKARAK